MASVLSEAVSARSSRCHEELLAASQLLDDAGRVELTRADIDLALADMHLQMPSDLQPVLGHPSSLLPASLYAALTVDVTELVRSTFPRVLEAHPIMRSMAEETLGNDAFYESVYFGAEDAAGAPASLSFAQLCRRLVASVYVFEELIALDRDAHAVLARWYETLYAERGAAAAAAAAAGVGARRRLPRSARDALMGFFLALKGESVLASINGFEMMRRASSRATNAAEAGSAQHGDEVSALSDVLNAIMSLNIFEVSTVARRTHANTRASASARRPSPHHPLPNQAVLSNLSFAFWPDNARAGMALLEAPAGAFRQDGTQALSPEWFKLYLAWNANFIWPSHYCADMMCFTMLAMPTIALGSPEAFQYNRAHSLFWVAQPAHSAWPWRCPSGRARLLRLLRARLAAPGGRLETPR